MPNPREPAELRPSDLARPYGLSSQAIRNYEDQGILPPAERTASGHRRYRERHRDALAAFLALRPAVGHASSADLVRAAILDDGDRLVARLAACFAQLTQDRTTLDLVAAAIEHVITDEPATGSASASIGALAHQLGVRPATLRSWQGAGILRPSRDPATGHRSYRPEDVRDAHLAHQLRRGGYPLAAIAVVVDELRQHGSRARLEEALASWRLALHRRGRALVQGMAALATLVDEATRSAATAPAAPGP